MKKLSLKDYLNATKRKLEDPVVRTMLSFGSTRESGPRLRDSDGLKMTFSTILNSARNLYTLTDGRDQFSTAVHNFSNTSEGYAQVADVKTVGAIDITIMALSQSLVPHVCVDRPMDTPDATIYFHDLVALNAAGGVNSGTVINGTFTPPVKVDLGSTTRVTPTVAAAPTITAAFGTGIVKTTARALLTTSDGSFIGMDVSGDGNLYFLNYAGATGQINYETGDIVITKAGGGNFAVTDTFTVTAERNMSYGDGAKVLRVTSKYTPVTLHSEPKNIVVEDNLANRMYMAKTNLLAGSTHDINDTLFTRTKNAFIEYINGMIIDAITTTATTDDNLMDLSAYDASKYAQTKNDLIVLCFNSQSAKFQAKTGILPTCCLTGSYGVALLSSVSGMWTPNPDITAGMNGLAGWFNGMAVYRHNFLNNSTSGQVIFYMVAKIPDNTSGSMVYGEFLPLTSTGVVSNFAMPSNIAQGYFTQNGIKVIGSTLINRSKILLPVALFNATGL